MELAFRMQVSRQELLDLSHETAATLKRYRVGKKLSVGTCRPTDFGRQCLLARRFAEAGVRFIEVNHGGWDQHKDHRRDLTSELRNRGCTNRRTVGGSCGAEDCWTILIGMGWRIRSSRFDARKRQRRESGHNEKGFTFWLAGGGVKPGYVHGRTDETGARAVEGKVHFRDLHATILHLLGLDHDQLAFQHGGRTHRLTGPEEAKVVHDLIA